MTLETPGLVCAHHHLARSLGRAAAGASRTPGNPRELDEWVWRPYEAALDHELIAHAARLAALEALEAGTTAVVDHHASPGAIEGSLDVVAAACAEVGVRVVCSYAVSEREGLDGAKAGLAENERFLRAEGSGYVGARDCATLSDDTLDAVCDLAADLGVGVHIGVAETETDSAAGSRLMVLADQSWLLAHAVHLERPLPGIVVHNPRSNMVHASGYARPARFDRVALGTDGIGADMLEELRLAFALGRSRDFTFSAEQAWRWLCTGHRIVPGAACDTVTWNRGIEGPDDVVWSTGLRPVRVVVDGEVVVDESGPTRVDAAEIRAHAREAAARLRSRIAEGG